MTTLSCRTVTLKPEFYNEINSNTAADEAAAAADINDVQIAVAKRRFLHWHT